PPRRAAPAPTHRGADAARPPEPVAAMAETKEAEHPVAFVTAESAPPAAPAAEPAEKAPEVPAAEIFSLDAAEPAADPEGSGTQPEEIFTLDADEIAAAKTPKP